MNFTLLLPFRLLFNPSTNVVFKEIVKRSYSSSDGLLKCKGIGSKKFVKNPDSALSDIQDGATLLIGGYGTCGLPENLICHVVKKGTKDLTIVSNICGVDNFGIGLLLKSKQIKRIITSFVGQNSEFENKLLAGEIEIELSPLGTLAERIRAGGAGIPAFYTATSVGSIIQGGGAPIKYGPDRTIEITSKPRSTNLFHGKEYVLEEAITGDFAFIKAWKADKFGNLLFRKTARNINPAMCQAAKVTIAEVEEMVDFIDPDQVHVPGIFIDKFFIGEKFEKRIEKLKITKKSQTAVSALASTPAVVLRERIIRRAALECKPGMCVNLGMGLPMSIIKYVPTDLDIIIHSEVGALGIGNYPSKSDVDPELINSDRETVTELPGASYFGTDLSFDMIRGGHVNVAILSAMEVSKFGDISNWIVPGQVIKGIGAAMDLVYAPNTKHVVAMEHCLKDGSPKIVDSCQLPITGSKCVDMIITEKGVFTVHPEQGLTLIEIAEGVEVPEILMSTGCDFQVAPELKKMEQIILSTDDQSNEAVSKESSANLS